MIDQAPSPDSRFQSLVLAIRSGARVDMSEIAGILAVSGRSHADLVSSLVSRSQSAQPGDTCDCGGRVGVYCTRRVGGRRVQYLACRTCGAKPANNKRTTI
jgi:RecJ-like exonuclease